MKKSIIFLSLVLSGLAVKAQTYDDAQLWFNLYLEKKINSKFDVHLNQQDRWVSNVSQYGLGYADIGVTIKLHKNIKLLVDYVYAQKRKNNDSYSTRHQYYAAIIFKKDIGRWRFMYRNMVQSQYKDPYTSKQGKLPHYYDRNKFTIKHETNKRISFYVAEELNIPLNNQQTKGFSRSRTFIGTFLTTTKHQQLEFYFMYQTQLQNGDWYNQDDSYRVKLLKRSFVYGIGYSIEF